MLTKIHVIGDIREGKLYIKLNEDDYEVVPNILVNGFRQYIGVFDYPKQIKKIIARVENEGFILSEYNIGEQQNLETFHEAFYDGEHWTNTYTAVVYTPEGHTAVTVVPDECFKALEILEKVRKYHKTHSDIETDEELTLAIEIVKKYSGWKGLY